jgi:hypothetical protein
MPNGSTREGRIATIMTQGSAFGGMIPQGAALGNRRGTRGQRRTGPAVSLQLFGCAMRSVTIGQWGLATVVVAARPRQAHRLEKVALFALLAFRGRSSSSSHAAIDNGRLCARPGINSRTMIYCPWGLIAALRT